MSTHQLPSRREFLKTSTVATVGASLASLAVTNQAHALAALCCGSV